MNPHSRGGDFRMTPEAYAEMIFFLAARGVGSDVLLAVARIGASALIQAGP